MNHFHDNAGWLIVGLDRHFGTHWPTPIPVPMFFWELNLMHPFLLGSTQCPTVQLNGGHNAAQDQYECPLLWLHFPVIPDPLNMLMPIDLLFGNHKTWLPRGTVHVEGTPAAVTILPCMVSMNMDCWTGSNLPSSIVLQPGTVVTTPDLWDYFKMAVRFIIEVIKEYIACRKIVKSQKGGVMPARNKRHRWSSLGTNLNDTFGASSKYGQRARSTIRNTIYREFMSRTFPLDITRENKKVFLELQSPQKVFKWAMGATGLSGDTPPASFGEAAGNVLQSVIPGYSGVENAVQYWDQRSAPPPLW